MRASATLAAVNVWAYCRHPLLVVFFWLKIGRLPAIAAPRTFHEKMLWRKIFDHSPAIARLSDKLEAKRFFKECCPDLAMAEPVWSGTRADAIPDEVLRGDVVVKGNFGCGYNIFVRAGRYDRRELIARADAWLRAYPYGRRHGEWAYSRIEPKLFVEPMLRTVDGAEPMVIEFHAFAGCLGFAYVSLDCVGGPEKANLFEVDGTRLSATPLSARHLPQDFAVPDAFRRAADCSRKLSEGFDYVRVDFLCCDDVLYAGEFTFYTMSGYGIYSEPEPHRRLARAWDLRRSWFLTAPQGGWRRWYAEVLRQKCGREL